MSRPRTTIAAACAALGAGLGLAAGTLMPPRYTAQAQLILDPTDAGAADGGAERAGDALTARVENQIRVITSESVLRRLIASERLDEDPEFNGSVDPGPLARVANALRGMAGAGEPKAASPTRAAMRVLQNDVSATREARSTVVRVGVTAGDPHRAMLLADGLVSAFVAETADAREAAGRKAAAAFDGRIADARQALEQAERRVAEQGARDAGAAAARSAGGGALAAAAGRLDQARAASGQAAAAHQQALRAQRANEADLVPEALRSGVLTGLRTQLVEVLRRAADLTATRGPRHPDVIEIRAREAAIRRPLAEEIARIAATARTAADAARAEERRLEKSLDGLKAAAEAPKEAAPRLRELERERDARRSLVEAALARAREAAEQNAGTADIRVISNASLPDRRVWPPATLLLVLGGLALGLVAGAILAALPPGTRRAGRRPPPSPGRAIVRS